MPVYELKVAGQDKPRMVKADTPAQARNHVVTAAGISAERMAELLDDGVKLEKAEPATAEAEGTAGAATAGAGAEGKDAPK
jgi:hypothetical protein